MSTVVTCELSVALDTIKYKFLQLHWELGLNWSLLAFSLHCNRVISNSYFSCCNNGNFYSVVL